MHGILLLKTPIIIEEVCEYLQTITNIFMFVKSMFVLGE